MKLLMPFFLFYLRIFASLQIQKLHLFSTITGRKFQIIALTGSAGKTSAIQAMEAALSPHFKVKTNQNYNSEYGLPANILGFKLDSYSPLSWAKVCLLAPLKILTNNYLPELYLVEMDVDGPSEPLNIRYLLRILKPDMAIHLNVSNVHTQNFDPLIPLSITGTRRATRARQLMCQEQAVLTQSLLPHQIAILNPHDPLVWATRKDIQAKVISIEKCAANSIFGKEVIFSRTSDQHGTSLPASGGSTKNLSSPKKPKYIFPQVYDITFGTAITLAHILGIPKSQAIQNIKANFHLPPGRAGLFAGKSGSTIIDSTYNASPQPMREFLDLLKSLKTNDQKLTANDQRLKANSQKLIAILGDMRELGHQSAPEHRSLAPHALACADLILTVGPQMQKYFPNHKKIHKFLYYWQVLDYLKKINTKNSIILVKGSQNTIFLEEVVKELLLNPADAQYLCRQGLHWLKIKANFRQNRQ